MRTTYKVLSDYAVAAEPGSYEVSDGLALAKVNTEQAASEATTPSTKSQNSEDKNSVSPIEVSFLLASAVALFWLAPSPAKARMPDTKMTFLGRTPFLTNFLVNTNQRTVYFEWINHMYQLFARNPPADQVETRRQVNFTGKLF